MGRYTSDANPLTRILCSESRAVARTGGSLRLGAALAAALVLGTGASYSPAATLPVREFQSQLTDRAVESARHLQDIQNLAGAPSPSPIAADAEQRALRAGATFAPTPYGLGSEGCMAAVSDYVLQPVAKDFGISIPRFRSTTEFLSWARSHPQTVSMRKYFINDLTIDDLLPGDILIGAKGDGNHAMVMARVPADWGWNPRDLMAVGNTGLPQFGPPAMRLAQEYIGPGLLPGEPEHNQHHGMLNSLSPNNPYRFGGGGTFYVVRFNVPHS